MRRKTINTTSDAVRVEVINLIDDMTTKNKNYDLPDPPEGLNCCRESLVDNTFTLLVCGEAKRGKSSFINGLLGRALLPTDQEVATNQACRIEASTEEAFRVRYEDGSVRQITADQISLVASETGRDPDETTGLESLIHWIECDVRATFLPTNVKLIDTPGVGSLVAQHAIVTSRFLPGADAVIFVVDSLAPITDLECKLLDRILQTTRDIFFVQTKTDCVSGDDWRELKDRNEDILLSEFGDRLDNTTIWPVSSEMLMKAAAGGDAAPIYLGRSGHESLAAALHDFLERVTELRRTSTALAVLEGAHRHGAQVLAARRKSLAEQSQQKLAETEQNARATMEQFRNQWGPNGSHAKRLQSKIDDILQMHQQSFHHFLQHGGKAQSLLGKKIALLDCDEELRELEENVDGEVAAMVSDQWRHTQESARKCILKQLLPLSDAVEMPVLPGVSEVELSGPDKPAAPSDDPWELWEQIKGTAREGFIENMLFGQAHVLAVALFPPCIPVLMAFNALSIWRNWGASKDRRKEQRKQELRRRVAESLQQFQSSFHHTDLESGRGHANKYFEQLRTSVMAFADQVVRKKLDDSRMEIELFQRNAMLEASQRKTNLARVQQQRNDWNDLGRRLSAVALRQSGIRNRLVEATKPASSYVASTQ